MQILHISPQKKKKRFFVVTVKNHYTNKLQQHLFVVVVLWPLLLPLLTILTKCCLKHFNIETQCRCCYCVYCYWVVGCGIVLCATIHRQLQSSLTNQPTNQLKLQKYKMDKKELTLKKYSENTMYNYVVYVTKNLGCFVVWFIMLI